MGIALDEYTPDHSTISRTRRLIDVDTHREVFTWVLGVLADHGLLQGQRIAIDATTLEANAAMRSIVRRDTGESYEEFLRGLAKASGIETPTREDLVRLDRKRKKRMSNKDWKSPADQDARIAKMKDGRTHLAHKAEHAVDLDTGAVVAVTLTGADQGDTTTLDETLCEAGIAVSELAGREAELHPNDVPKVNLNGVEELVADKGYHSGAVVKRVKNYEVRSYIPEKQQKGQRDWQGKPEEQRAVYQNRRRVRGEYGKSLLRRRGELVERSFAHCYETGGMRRCHLRGRENILKRQLVHVGAFNLSLILRKLLGAGTPRELKNRAGKVFSRLLRFSLRRMSSGSLIGRLTSPAGSQMAPSFRCRTPRHRSRIFSSSATDCYGGVLTDNAGNIYGATAMGGPNGGGVVYELSPTGDGWTFTILWSLTGDPNNWDGPQSTPVMDATGTLYFTTVGQGSHGCGTAFRLKPGGGTWAYKLLHDFTCRPLDGGVNSGLVVDKYSWVYGSTNYGDLRDSAYEFGAVYAIVP